MIYLYKIGIILVTSVFFGEFASRLKLPRLIGYLAGGFLLGPSVLDLLDREFLHYSQPLKEFLLAFILFVIGCKIKGARLKNIGEGLTWIASFEIAVTLILVSVGFFFFIGKPVYALLIGVIAAATAPAASAMITEEYHSEGPFTDSVLCLVGIDNLLVLLLFNLTVPLILHVVMPTYLVSVLAHALVSAALGILTGISVSYVESRISKTDDILLFILSFGIFFLGLGITNILGGYILVFSLFMGVTMTNSSLKNYEALSRLSYIKTPVYILFFFIAGASLHLETISEMRWAVAIYILLRTGGKLIGAYLGALSGRLDDTFRRYTGAALLTHAGLATGLAIYLGDNGGEAGHQAMNIILPGTIFFELTGPLLLRWTLLKAGEVKVIHIMKKGMEPVLDRDFHSVISELGKAFGLRRFSKRGIGDAARIKHVMRKNFISLSPDDHIERIVKGFERTHFNAIPVINNINSFHGMIHLKTLEYFFLDDVTKTLIVADDLVVQFPTISIDDDLHHALRIMQEEALDCLPVVNGEILVGIVTRRDIVTGIA